MFQRSIPAALCAALITAAASTASAAAFRDIDDSFAKADILALHSRGVIGGYTDGTFRPEAPITRAEFAALLMKSKGFPASDRFEGAFRDAQRGEWFTPYAELSYRLGITSGTMAGRFDPAQPLTRQEMVRMAVSALGRESETARRMDYAAYSRQILKYADRSLISSWAVKSMAYAIQTGMIQGYGGRISPQQLATRAEVAAFVNRSVASKPKGTQRVTISSRGDAPFLTKKTAEATAYTHSGSLSYIGMQVREGIVAVDPNQIPLGSHLFIPGYGYGIAGDTGGAIKQARVDLFHYDSYEAIRFGRKNVDIFILD